MPWCSNISSFKLALDVAFDVVSPVVGWTIVFCVLVATASEPASSAGLVSNLYAGVGSTWPYYRSGDINIWICIIINRLPTTIS